MQIMKRSIIKPERNGLFPHSKMGILALLVCVTMIAALFLSIYLIRENNDFKASEDAGEYEEFLRDSETAGLPLIKIWTDSGEKPAFSVVEAPEGLMGISIKDNSYKNGYCTIENVSSMPQFSSKMKIKVRGNASAVDAGENGKLPYKLVLDSPIELFEDETTETKFFLLADAGVNLKTWLGLRIGELCGVEWTIRNRYINLVLNDEYQGLYLLTEARDGNALQEHVGDGFFIESDPYWWNEDVYFHSKYLAEQTAFTVKSPELEDMNDRRLKEIEAYMDQVGEDILHGNLEDIDMNTFSAWLCAHDYLDTADIGGSNVFYYLEDLPGGDKSANRLKMGPLWDFDSSFGWPSDPEKREHLSAYHSVPYTFFPVLFRNNAFLDIYRNRMDKTRVSLYDSCSSQLESLCNELEGPINASREADARRWGESWTPVREEADERLQWLSERIAWTESQLSPVTKKNGEIEYRRFIADVSDDFETLTIALYDDGYEGVQFPTWSDENGQDDVVWYKAELNEDQFWETVVPLSDHHSAGVYNIHAYATIRGKETLVKRASTYVESATEH